MTLSPAAAAMLAEVAGAPAPGEVAVEVARARASERARVPGRYAARTETRELTIDGPGGPLRLRLYRPHAGTLPVVVFFHGGGWVLCDLDTHHAMCHRLAAGAEVAVVSVDYRRAPEHRFPAASDDAAAATDWIGAHGAELGLDSSRLAVAGDSAGGNLAAAVALMAASHGVPTIALQVLLYPILDHDFETASYLEHHETPTLQARGMRWFWDQYVPDAAQRDHPLASPLRAADLSGVAPAHVVTAEHDPLRDEAEAYAARLRGTGSETTSVRYGGMFHGFLSYADVLPAAGAAMDDVCGVIQRALTR